VTIAVLSNRDGSLSSIWRHLTNHYEKLMTVLEMDNSGAVSRPQLPRVLEKVSIKVFDNLIFSHFGVRLSAKERKWFAFDGKELRGSIAKGEKRGTALVQVVAHENGETVAQDYYCGKKESEKPKVRQMMGERELAGEKITFDALHCNPKTLSVIGQAGGKYVVGLKNNQKELLKQVINEAKNMPVMFETGKDEKGHGRIERRSYEIFDILEMEKAGRWDDCQIRTAIKVQRKREEVKTGKQSVETSWYVSNEVGKYEETVLAIRRHWQIETNNHRRDVTFKEDKMRSKKRMYRKQWRKLEH
jgi:predicted transposase YbfD/YdcC